MSTTTCSTANSNSATASCGALTTDMILPGTALTLRYTEQLVNTIPADIFAKMPMPDLNSPAFYIGHLSTYGDRVCTMLGRNDLVTPMPYSVDLFKAGAVCLDQPGLYPSKETLVSTFFERQRRAIEAFTTADSKTLAAENPAEGRFRELFPTIGSAVCFMLLAHPMMHLGQISAWRRAMGLGSAS